MEVGRSVTEPENQASRHTTEAKYSVTDQDRHTMKNPRSVTPNLLEELFGIPNVQVKPLPDNLEFY
ncbi:MAG TPA: hypothetical protein VJ044_17295, partial [Candidatus Hodarchaeales archaeon]|nr:hypothetical protein [Candidatus Hodarchaeales archaeon]